MGVAFVFFLSLKFILYFLILSAFIPFIPSPTPPHHNHHIFVHVHEFSNFINTFSIYWDDLSIFLISFINAENYNIFINFPMLHQPCISGINMAFLYMLTSLIFSLGFFYFCSWEIYLYFFFLLIFLLSFVMVSLYWPGNMSWGAFPFNLFSGRIVYDWIFYSFNYLFWS